MPAFCTHYLFGEDFIVNLPKEKKHNKHFRKAFFYGVQGPDFMFFHRALPTMRGKSMRSLGTRMHNDSPVKLFEVFKELVRLNPDNDYVTGYAAGFLCHYALDRCAHPYINFLQAAIIKKEKIKYLPSVVHNRIETNIDRFMLKERFKINDARTFNAKAVLSGNKRVLVNISTIMTGVVSEVYGVSVSRKTMETAFRDFRKIEGMLSDETYWKMPLAKALELPFRFKFGTAISSLIRGGKMKTDWDYPNETNSRWINLDSNGRAHDESFLQIYEYALEDAMRMYEALFAGEDVEKITDNISFKTGVRLKREDEKAESSQAVPPEAQEVQPEQNEQALPPVIADDEIADENIVQESDTESDTENDNKE